MDNQILEIRHDYLLAASALVPTAQRNTFFAILLMGPVAINEEIRVPEMDGATSFPLNDEQARELKEKIDQATWELIMAIANNAKDGVGVIDWSEVKRITGVTSWAQFAKGRMGGVHRSLRKMEGIPDGAVLFWEGDGWVEDGKGDYIAGTVGIDGPAIQSLQKLKYLK